LRLIQGPVRQVVFPVGFKDEFYKVKTRNAQSLPANKEDFRFLLIVIGVKTIG
jgi:hypothetical protein